MSQSRFGKQTTADEVATAFADQINGKTVLITGVSLGGLGAEVSRTLSLHQPRLLIIAGRSTPKLEATAANLKTLAPHVKTRLLQLDLQSQKQIRKAAAEVNAYEEVVDVLINNAATWVHDYATTEDGIESQFGTNHIGHFLFTNLLLSKMLAADKKLRIVNVSSRGHRLSGIRWEDPNFQVLHPPETPLPIRLSDKIACTFELRALTVPQDGAAYNEWLSYGQSKTANMLFSVSLAEKLGARGVQSFSLHPGAINTNLANAVSTQDMKDLGFLDENGNIIAAKWKTFGQGAATYVVAGFDPDIADRNGTYLVDCQVDHDDIYEAHAKSNTEARKLWALSEELVGQKFEY
ncbi:hypothetical protein MMC15_004638 [Xylographa vitiligo]|nr:hypothetical protein [Xylographa vitiligo]